MGMRKTLAETPKAKRAVTIQAAARGVTSKDMRQQLPPDLLHVQLVRSRRRTAEGAFLERNRDEQIEAADDCEHKSRHRHPRYCEHEQEPSGIDRMAHPAVRSGCLEW